MNELFISHTHNIQQKCGTDLEGLDINKVLWLKIKKKRLICADVFNHGIDFIFFKSEKLHGVIPD